MHFPCTGIATAPAPTSCIHEDHEVGNLACMAIACHRKTNATTADICQLHPTWSLRAWFTKPRRCLGLYFADSSTDSVFHRNSVSHLRSFRLSHRVIWWIPLCHDCHDCHEQGCSPSPTNLSAAPLYIFVLYMLYIHRNPQPAAQSQQQSLTSLNFTDISHTHTHVYIYIIIYIYFTVFVENLSSAVQWRHWGLVPAPWMGQELVTEVPHRSEMSESFYKRGKRWQKRTAQTAHCYF